MSIPMKKPDTSALPATVPVPALSSNELIQRAIESGNIEIVGKIMDYQERWEKSQARKAFDNAMSAAKAEMPVILKDKVVDFTSQKGRTNYQYEDFATIYNAVTPVLSKHGLDARFRTVSDKEAMTVICIISHRDGYREENSLTAPNDLSGNKNAIQAIGSTQTYLQRYTLKAALGLAASKDDDAQSAGKKDDDTNDQPEPKPNKQQPQAAPAKPAPTDELPTQAQINELIDLCGTAKKTTATVVDWVAKNINGGVKRELPDFTLADYQVAKKKLNKIIEDMKGSA